MAELTVKRWRRYGKDRLYVNLPDGGRVGWLDLQTGQTTLEREELRGAFEAALRAHAPEDGDPPGPSAAPAAAEATPRPGSEEPPVEEPFAITIDWRDVGVRKAGQAAQQQAETHRRAAPVRTSVARLLGVHTDERAWRVGAAGERRVAARLEKLPEPWKVLHAIPVGKRGADIDHLVLGPGGVFTVNAKHHPDATIWVGGETFLVNGHRQPYVRNSRHEAGRASRLLSRAVGFDVAVTGVIAVVGARGGFTIKSAPEDVQVVAPKGLARSLPRLPAVLGDGALEQIHRAARRSDTWTGS